MNELQIQVVILTKSAKFGKFCVAGIDVHTGKWVRLTSSDANCHGAIDGRYLRYTDNTICNVLDVVAVAISSHSPQNVQPENYLIDERFRFKKIGKMSINDAIAIHPCEKHEYIFGNEYCCINEQNINDVGHSLTLVEVRDLILTKHNNNNNQPKTKAAFIYNKMQYNDFAVTDQNFFCINGIVKYKHAYLVVSLPDSPYAGAHNNYYYKFIAKIFV